MSCFAATPPSRKLRSEAKASEAGVMEPRVSVATPDDLADRARRERYLAILSPGERLRLARLLSKPKQELFLLAHGLLRTELSQCADVDPAAWQFSSGAHGRPEIAAPESSLRFNLSHTEGLAACAVTDGRDVGIDVEDITREHSRGLAERVFSPREQKSLRDLQAGEQARGFFELWTLKEAYLKARGLGLTVPLRGFSFYRDAAGEWRIEFDASGDGARCEDDPRRWTFRSWRVGARHQAALALPVD
jgi:4'-phosphopantetheinyl transferase